MHAISSYRGNRSTHTHTHPQTHKQTHRQDRLQYTSPQLASAQCNYASDRLMHPVSCCHDVIHAALTSWRLCVSSSHAATNTSTAAWPRLAWPGLADVDRMDYGQRTVHTNAEKGHEHSYDHVVCLFQFHSSAFTADLGE